MSHYTVAVITKNDDYEELEKLLAPFDENLQVNQYISRTKQEMIKDAKKYKESCLEKIEKADNKELKEYLTSNRYSYMRQALELKTDEDFYNFELYDGQNYDKDGNELSTYNPNSKWDWYSIGGRWSGMLKNKHDNEYYDSLKISDCDFSPDPEDIKNAEKFWEYVVEHKKPENDDEHNYFSLYNDEYYIEKYKTKENYAKITSAFQTYAVLTPDGEWLEPGEMGWWGISHADIKDQKDWEEGYKENIIDKLNPDWYITIVDCHI